MRTRVARKTKGRKGKLTLLSKKLELDSSSGIKRRWIIGKLKIE